MDQKSKENLYGAAIWATVKMLDRMFAEDKPMDTIDVSVSSTSATPETEQSGKVRIVHYNTELLQDENGTWSPESIDTHDEVK